MSNPLLMMRLGVRLLAHKDADAHLEGVALIEKAAAEGCAPACCRAATLVALGVGQSPDWALALDHLERGARLGSKMAQSQLQALTSASPSRSTPSTAWKRLRDGVNLQFWREPPPRVALSQTPRIRVVTDMAPPSVCAWIIGRGRMSVRRAETFDPASGAGRHEAGRTNSAAVLDFLDLDVVTVLLRARIARLAGTHPSALEPSQVLHYAPGERFAPHYDFLDPETPALARQLSESGQRIATVLVYLNDDYADGETTFPHVGLRHRGSTGDALMFANVDQHNEVDRLTLHAGDPPRRGDKWVFSQWIRDRARI